MTRDLVCRSVCVSTRIGLTCYCTLQPCLIDGTLKTLVKYNLTYHIKIIYFHLKVKHYSCFG